MSDTSKSPSLFLTIAISNDNRPTETACICDSWRFIPDCEDGKLHKPLLLVATSLNADSLNMLLTVTNFIYRSICFQMNSLEINSRYLIVKKVCSLKLEPFSDLKFMIVAYV